MPLVSLLALLGVWLAGGVVDPSRTGGTLPVGRLIEHVSSASVPGQRYTLYVPTGYQPSRPAPILYLLDPRGRARVPASLFRDAAEQFGYILVSSHNSSSDGPVEPTLRALQAMWTDTHQWFRVDDRRVYLGGFSGTARISTLVARQQPGAIAGLIAAGAGFHPDAMPSGSLKTLYYATSGNADYNYHDVKSAEDALIGLRLPHRVEHFAGAHSWMPAPLARQAIEWLEVRAMAAGSRPRDELLVETWWARDLAAAAAWQRGGLVLDAGRRYAAMAADFAGLRDTSEAAALATALLASPTAKSQARRRRAEAGEAITWARNAMQSIADAFPEDALAPALTADDLGRELEIGALKKRAVGTDAAAALEAQRRLGELEVQLGFYLPYDAMARAELTRAAFYLSLAVRIDDSSPVAWYLTAEVHARLDARHAALAALRRAVQAGFRDLPALESDPDLRAIRGEPEFAAIVAPARAQGDTLDSLKVDRPPVHTPR